MVSEGRSERMFSQSIIIDVVVLELVGQAQCGKRRWLDAIADFGCIAFSQTGCSRNVGRQASVQGRLGIDEQGGYLLGVEADTYIDAVFLFLAEGIVQVELSVFGAYQFVADTGLVGVGPDDGGSFFDSLDTVK